MDKNTCNCEEGEVMRKGPWTWEEDLLLTNYISDHGESVWNSLARSAGLKRTGKSCRLRWLNYLRPDVRRGNITPQEQILIMDLHSKLGNRWSKIAKHLPGRTDNEIKNFWRTRIQKHMKQRASFEGQSYECNEEASRSKMSYATYDTLDNLSSPSYSYQESMETNFKGPFLTQLNDSNFWSMEDPWPL